MPLTALGKEVEIFDGQARVLHTGTEFGIVHPKDPDFADQFSRIKNLTGQDRILAQKLSMNTKVTPVDSTLQLERQDVPGFFRTPEASDGVIVSINGDTRERIAVMIMNADCGSIQILAPNGELAVLHGGFDNVDNKDGSSIVLNAIDHFGKMGITPDMLRMRVGEAAQACCYGLNHPKFKPQNEARAARIKDAYGVGTVSRVQNSPRSANEGIGFDVSLIAAKQAEIAGIKDIDIERLCTSCHGLAAEAMQTPGSFGTWYSNVREGSLHESAKGKYGSRNAVVVW